MLSGRRTDFFSKRDPDCIGSPAFPENGAVIGGWDRKVCVQKTAGAGVRNADDFLQNGNWRSTILCYRHQKSERFAVFEKYGRVEGHVPSWPSSRNAGGFLHWGETDATEKTDVAKSEARDLRN